MFRYEDETWKVASMDELLALARSMELEAIDGYMSLSRRMNEMGRHDMAEVFDSLVEEERGHLGKVEEWREGLGRNEATVPPSSPEESFDDEGAGIMAPELLSAYRAFSMAVRNEERAFVFWSYVSAHAQSVEIRKAAERMAREELGHVATLRRERRKAFHLERDAAPLVVADLKSSEELLARHLDLLVVNSDEDTADILRKFSNEARRRAQSIATQPFDVIPQPNTVSQATFDQARPLSEYLIDRYLDAGGRARREEEADRAMSFAAELIACLRVVRSFQ